MKKFKEHTIKMFDEELELYINLSKEELIYELMYYRPYFLRSVNEYIVECEEEVKKKISEKVKKNNELQ